jgi:multiple sugar transport system permease protein
MVSSALVLILVFALIGTLQFFSEPQILKPISNGSITPDFTPNIYAFNLAFGYAQFNYASAISFALGIVVFIAVYLFMFATRKRGSSLS